MELKRLPGETVEVYEDRCALIGYIYNGGPASPEVVRQASKRLDAGIKAIMEEIGRRQSQKAE